MMLEHHQPVMRTPIESGQHLVFALLSNKNNQNYEE
jgi:hypothetical protein